jgi:D-alanyl-D-alanine carboxypeptidase/D-alanyl-D-alanine-endopeptidase (penicillin-binding protein 4)
MGKRILGLTVLFLVGVLFTGQAKTAAPAGHLNQVRDDTASRIESILKKSKINQSKMGISVYSVSQSKTLYQKNHDVSFVVASNAKLFTTATAIEKLGSDFHFITPIYYRGKITQDGALNGDIVVVGGGDPNISGRFYNGDPSYVFKLWVAEAKKLGIKQVKGNIVLDDHIFDRNFVCEEWRKHGLWNWWVAPVGALSLNDNCVDLKIIGANEEKKPPEVKVSPQTGYVIITNNATSVSKVKNPLSIKRKKDDSNEIEITGEIKLGDEERESIAINNPTYFFGTVLKETFEDAGVPVLGEVVAGQELPREELKPIAQYKSDILKTITVANRVSQNFYAECLLKYLGYKFKNSGTTENGISVTKEFLKDVGMKNVEIVDGCGLSRNNKASASDMTKLLLYMNKGRYFKDFLGSLAVGGAKEGTLKRRFLSEMFKERVFAKTGHIAGVNTFSGYIKTKTGGFIIVSILINDPRFSKGDELIEEICGLLVERLE